MSEKIHVLAQQLFDKTSVAACDLQEIKDLVTRYPYFAPAQFLLLEKLREVASPEYATQLQKAVLFYHNPLEFEYFISSDKFYSLSETGNTKSPQQLHDTQNADSLEINLDHFEQDNGIPHQINDMETAAEKDSEVFFQTEEKIEFHPDHDKDQIAILEKKLGQIREKLNDEQNLAAGNADPVSTLPLLQEVSAGLTFEPFHTVDYFASQGIKLSQDEVGKDQLGKQLKSFTEWLKTMKRLKTPETINQVETPIEKKVQHLAEDSVHESNIVTEAMAEVWLKQGNTQKAIDIYNLLSLQNPSKLAYFAAKIDLLKRT